MGEELARVQTFTLKAGVRMNGRGVVFSMYIHERYEILTSRATVLSLVRRSRTGPMYQAWAQLSITEQSHDPHRLLLYFSLLPISILDS